MKELNFDTGLVTYKVNGRAEISFNPSDVGFVEKLFNTFDGLAKRQDAAENENSRAEGAALFELAKKRDKEMREEIDNIFGEPVCDRIFGNVNVFASADGMPLWCNFLLAVIDEIDASVEGMQERTSARVEKYKAKYAKYSKV